MSDKETAPHFQVPPDNATRAELVGALQYWVIRAKTAERVAVECRAPAPQPAENREEMFDDWVYRLHSIARNPPLTGSYVQMSHLVREIFETGWKAATPQVTPAPGVQWFVTRRTVKQAFHLSVDPTLAENDMLHEFLGATKWESDRDGGLLIHTLEGVMRADSGDWIIRGIKGEFYPCKPDIFAVTYEPFEAEEWNSIETVIGEIGKIVLGGLPKGAGFVFRADLIRKALQKLPLAPIIPAAKRYCKICDEVRGDDSDAAVSLRRNAFMELSKACNQEGTSEQASPTPDKCPTCGSNQQSSFWRGCREKSTIPDSWHSSAATQKGSTKD